MKITFICGSLEPGRDGVGDYVRLLATEIIRQGHHAIAVAMNDLHITDEYSGIQKVENVDLSVLRISSSLSEKQRFKRAKIWIDEFGPDWISIQFVPYSFHPKGLPFFWIFYLKKLTRERRVHIMFHETWVGCESKRWRLILLSVLQKMLIKKILHSIQPSVIHTHIPTNYFRLQKLGWMSKVLPLFSNIGAINKKQSSTGNNIFRIGFFSQAENMESIASFLICLGKQAIKMKMQIEVLLIGGVKPKMIEFANSIEKLENYNNRVKHTGFLAPEELSEALYDCTLGITSVPRHALGKSGSVAAFLAHGIPVAAPNVHERYNSSEIGFFIPELCQSIVLEPEFNLFQKSKKAAIKASQEIMSDKIAKIFLFHLETSTS